MPASASSAAAAMIIPLPRSFLSFPLKITMLINKTLRSSLLLTASHQPRQAAAFRGETHP